MNHLGTMTWPEVASGAGALLAIPLGSTEQHGPHLPLDTDTRIAVAVAEGLAARHRQIVVAPPLPYGSSGEHAGFAGTLSIGQAALELVVVELMRSLGPEFVGVVVVCGHGGNAEALRRAEDVLRAEGRRLLVWLPCIAGGDAHAGRSETSIMLALQPALVRVDRAVAGATKPLVQLMGPLRRGGVVSVSANGVLGDPTGASVAEGQALLAGLVDDIERRVALWFDLATESVVDPRRDVAP